MRDYRVGMRDERGGMRVEGLEVRGKGKGGGKKVEK